MVGVTLELRPPDEREDDRHSIHSIASTVATTTSLASRIRDLNLFEEVEKEAEKDGDRTLHSPLPEDPEEEHAETSGNAADEEECGRAGPLSEEDLSISHSLHLLHRDPPLQVHRAPCCSLVEVDVYTLIIFLRVSLQAQARHLSAVFKTRSSTTSHNSRCRPKRLNTAPAEPSTSL